MTLPSGSPVGTTSGAPTVVPAGWYAVNLTEPGCVELLYFELGAPGVSIFDDMGSGELTYETYYEDLEPNSTYVWKNPGDPSDAYTFVTSNAVVGTPPAPAPTTPYASSGKDVSNSSVVGSAVLPSRGALSASLAASGVLTLVYRGGRVSSLEQGRYRISVADQSTTHEFVLRGGGDKAITVTGIRFVGTHSVAVDLIAGRWTITTKPGATPVALEVVRDP